MRKRELAAVRHGVAGIDREVDDHLLELGDVGLDRPQVAAVHDVERDVLADQPAQQHVEIGQRLAEVEHLRPQRLLAREGQQMPHQARGAVGVLLDLHDVLERRIGRPVRVQQEVGRHHDGAEHVVEVVRDAAGELADRLHLLRLGELVLERALLGGLERIDDRRLVVALLLLDRGDVETGEALARTGERGIDRRDLALPVGGAGGSRLRAPARSRSATTERIERSSVPLALEHRLEQRARTARSSARSGPACRRSRSPSAYCGRSA